MQPVPRSKKSATVVGTEGQSATTTLRLHDDEPTDVALANCFAFSTYSPTRVPTEVSGVGGPRAAYGTLLSYMFVHLS